MNDTIMGLWIRIVRSRLRRRSACELDFEPFSLSLSVAALQARFVEREREGWHYVGTARSENGSIFQLWSRGSDPLEDVIAPVGGGSWQMGARREPALARRSDLTMRPAVSRPTPRGPGGASCGHVSRRRHGPSHPA